MFYLNNLPAWERGARLMAGMAMVACGIVYWGQPAGWAFLAFGVTAALTGVVGFCPACALAGRRLRTRAKAAP